MNVSVITLACLCAGLLFDPAGFLRLSLLASFIHETGHIIFYVICKSKFPKVTVTAFGISLNSTNNLSVKQDLVVTCAGPLFNLLAAILFLLIIQVKASYMLYFFAAVNICIGAYNLLPIGILDGARLLSMLEYKCEANSIYTLKKIMVFVFSIIILFACVFLNLNVFIKAGLIGSVIYLIYKAQ